MEGTECLLVKFVCGWLCRNGKELVKLINLKARNEGKSETKLEKYIIQNVYTKLNLFFIL